MSGHLIAVMTAIFKNKHANIVIQNQIFPRRGQHADKDKSVEPESSPATLPKLAYPQ